MSAATKESDRRRYRRYGIELDAILLIEGSSSIPCSILDFCAGGLFLDVKQSNKNFSSLQNKNVKIKFSVSEHQGNINFLLNAQIRRVTANGVGIAFEKTNISVVNALKNETNIDSDADASDHSTSSPNPANTQSLERSFKKLLGKTLPLLLKGFFRCVNEELMAASDKAASNTDGTAYFEAISKLKTSRKIIASEFCNAVLGGIYHMDEARIEQIPEGNGDGYSLSLVDKVEFEDWLNLSSIIRKTENQFKGQLDELENKLSHVTGIPLDSISNPISPAKICDSFRIAIEDADDNNNVKQTLYNAFEIVLSSQLPIIYKQFDAVLVSHGAPGTISHSTIKRSHSSAINKQEPSKDESIHSNQQTDEVEQAVEQNPQQPQIADTQTALTSHLSELLAEQHQAQSVTQTADNLLNLLRQTNGISPDNGGSQQESIDTNLPEYSSGEILAAITQLQGNESGNSKLHENTIALQQQLLETLTRVNSDSKRLAEDDKNSLEVSGRLFDALSADLTLSPGTKSHLEDIHLPLLALALQDSEFLNSETHPARSVLNQLASLEGAVNGNAIINNKSIDQTVEELIAKITQNSINDPNIFAQVDQQLREITLPVTKSKELNIQRVIEVCEGKQKIEAAKQTSQKSIDQRIAGKRIPKIVESLLSAGWQHLLFLTELREGKNSVAGQKYLTVIDKLLNWLSDQESLSDRDNTEIQGVISFIDNQLSLVCSNTFLQSKVIDEITATLLGLGMPRIRNPIEWIDIEPIEKTEAKLDDVIEDYWTNQVDQLRIGDWLMFSLAEEGLEPLKLVWIGDSPNIFVFTNRKGQNKKELDRNDLAEQIRSGATTKIENQDVPLMDRATNSMLQSIHEKLMHGATHDPITTLINRKEFVKRLNYEFSRLNGSRHMLCYLEIQDFRVITNSCGLSAGDALLEKITALMQGLLGSEEILARLGDKSFGVLFKHCSSDGGQEIAKRIRDLINHSHFEWGDKSYSVGISQGLVPFSEAEKDVDILMQRADLACMSAKDSGHNRIQIYNDADENLKTQNDIHDWAGRIDTLFSENRLFVRCQMIAPIDPEKNDHSHYEILLGVLDGEGKVIPPDNFIPAAERFQRMPEIDRWIVQNVFNWIEENSGEFEQMGGFSINLSGQSLNSQEFLDFLDERLTSSAVPPEKITFEITETVAANNLDFVQKFIKQIKRFGCKFSLDDFGTGYSSYAYLKSLNVDYLKIDGTFVKDLATSETDVAMVKSMNEIGHSLGMETIAEYVEDNEILEVLRKIGVDYAQGWGIHKPEPLKELLETKPHKDSPVVPAEDAITQSFSI
ncbi:MAG: DUF1631 family protein [Methylococcales bacterium]